MQIDRLIQNKKYLRYFNMAFFAVFLLILSSCGGSQGAQEALKKGVFRVEEQIELYPEVVIDGPIPIDDESDDGDASDDTDGGSTDAGDGAEDDGDDSSDAGTTDSSDDGSDDDGSDDSSDAGTTDSSDDSSDDDGSDDSSDAGTTDSSDDGSDDDGSGDSSDAGTTDSSDDGSDDDGSDDSSDAGTTDSSDDGSDDDGSDDSSDTGTTDSSDDGSDDDGGETGHDDGGEEDGSDDGSDDASDDGGDDGHDDGGDDGAEPEDYLPIKRACWDRPRNYPTVNRAKSKAIFTYHDKHSKRFGFRELTGDDFYQQIPQIPWGDYEKSKMKDVMICQASSKDKCWADPKTKYPYGLIMKTKTRWVRRGLRRVIERSYEPIRATSKFSEKDPLEIIVENIGKYEGNERTRIKHDYCDVIYRDSSPILLDFSGKGYLLHRQSEGPQFDMDADGESGENISWTGREAAFLVLDLNNNGQIDSSREMFGTKTMMPDGSDSSNGFIGLSQYDDNNDLLIDENDGIYNSLELWIDENADGYTDPGELTSLEDKGVKALNLQYISTSEFDIFGNEAREKSTYIDMEGNHHLMVDIYFMTIEELN